jgi:hypothetical protein
VLCTSTVVRCLILVEPRHGTFGILVGSVAHDHGIKRHSRRPSNLILVLVLIRIPTLILIPILMLMLILLCLQLSQTNCCQVGRSLLECSESRRACKSDNVRLSRQTLIICSVSRPKVRSAHACARASARVHVCGHAHVCAHARVHGRTRVHAHDRTRVHTHTRTRAHSRTRALTHTPARKHYEKMPRLNATGHGSPDLNKDCPS